MARSRKANLAGRIRQKQATSLPPKSDAAAPSVVHVAPPVAPPQPPPAIEAPAASPEPPPAKAPATRPEPPALDAKDEEALRAIEASLAPAGARSGRRGIAVVATVAVTLGIVAGLVITRARGHGPATAAAAVAAPAQTAAPVLAPVTSTPESAPAPPPPPPPPVPSAAPTASASAAPPTASASTASAPTVVASASTAAPTASASASAEPAAAVDGQNATALRDQALELLKKMKDPEAMAAARAALDADPRDAMPYLVLGSALQDLNQWKEAHHTFELCAKNATKGMVDECHAMLRRH